MKQLFLLCILIFNIQCVWAEPASESLTQALKHIKTIEADFVQAVLGENEIVMQRSVGKMLLDRAYHAQALFYWKVISPNPSTLYFRDNLIIIYDRDLNQATIKKVDYKDPNMLPLMLLTGDPQQVLNNFLITSKDEHHYILRPKSKDKDNLLVGVILDLDSNGLIKEIQYQTTLGPRTQIIFNHAHINKTLDHAPFFESLPKGTDIVHVK